MTVVVTGAAGFIGHRVAERLLDQGRAVLGIDNLNDYYDVGLKRARLATLAKRPGFTMVEADIADRDTITHVIGRAAPSGVIHLAAQAGVRYSLVNPFAYAQTNIIGHLVMLEAMRALPDRPPFVYASSSSVYGGNEKIPFSIGDVVDQPVSLYAATKKSDELMTHAYSHLYDIDAVGLRFFTVYGPWGRPDMAPWLFTDAILRGLPIRVFNNGDMRRDFTHIDDITDGVLAALYRAPGLPRSAGVPHRLYNLGNERPENLLTFIQVIETAIGREAIKIFEPMQPGDVAATWADIDTSRRDLGYDPKTPITVGVPDMVRWFKDYHGLA